MRLQDVRIVQSKVEFLRWKIEPLLSGRMTRAPAGQARAGSASGLRVGQGHLKRTACARLRRTRALAHLRRTQSASWALGLASWGLRGLGQVRLRGF